MAWLRMPKGALWISTSFFELLLQCLLDPKPVPGIGESNSEWGLALDPKELKIQQRFQRTILPCGKFCVSRSTTNSHLGVYRWRWPRKTGNVCSGQVLEDGLGGRVLKMCLDLAGKRLNIRRQGGGFYSFPRIEAEAWSCRDPLMLMEQVDFNLWATGSKEGI